MTFLDEGTDELEVDFVEVEVGLQGAPGNDATAGTKGPNIPSSTTINLESYAGNFNHVTGTTDISSLATGTAGNERVLVFDGILTLINSSTLILPGAGNFTTAPGTVIRFRNEGGAVWRSVGFQHNIFDAIAQLAPTTGQLLRWSGTAWVPYTLPAVVESLSVAASDQETALTTGVKVKFNMPVALNLTAVRASLSDVSTSGLVTIDVLKAGVTIFSTKPTIDANEVSTQTAATPSVLSTTALALDDQISISIVGAGTGAKGLVVSLVGTA